MFQELDCAPPRLLTRASPVGHPPDLGRRSGAFCIHPRTRRACRSSLFPSSPTRVWPRRRRIRARRYTADAPGRSRCAGPRTRTAQGVERCAVQARARTHKVWRFCARNIRPDAGFHQKIPVRRNRPGGDHRAIYRPPFAARTFRSAAFARLSKRSMALTRPKPHLKGAEINYRCDAGCDARNSSCLFQVGHHSWARPLIADRAEADVGAASQMVACITSVDPADYKAIPRNSIDC